MRFRFVLSLLKAAQLGMFGGAPAPQGGQEEHVSGYTRADGTVVPPHTRHGPVATARPEPAKPRPGPKVLPGQTSIAARTAPPVNEKLWKRTASGETTLSEAGYNHAFETVTKTPATTMHALLRLEAGQIPVQRITSKHLGTGKVQSLVPHAAALQTLVNAGLARTNHENFSRRWYEITPRGTQALEQYRAEVTHLANRVRAAHGTTRG